MPVNWSIRKRLLSYLISGVTFGCAIATLALYVSTRDEFDELFDRQLKQIALSLVNQQDFSVSHSEVESDAKDEDEDGIVVIAKDHEGRTIFGPEREIPAFAKPASGYAYTLWNGERWRYYASSGSAGTVIAAQPLLARARIALGVVVRILLPMAALILALIGLVWISVGRGLRPLSQIALMLNHRAAHTLEPIAAEHPPVEITPFIAALNDLLARLAQELTKQTRFLADATHELRTPLTALRLQLELVQCAATDAERSLALARLSSGLERIIHLAQQLLTLARVDPAKKEQNKATADLSQVAINVIAEMWALARAKDLDLGMIEHEPACVAADPEAMRILITNILDNAIRYTPRCGKIDVSVKRERDDVVMQISDTGPGIPPHERNRVFDRFYRGIGQTQPGSGLGLAIVKGITERYGGRITLANNEIGQGLSVRVWFTCEALASGAPRHGQPSLMG